MKDLEKNFEELEILMRGGAEVEIPLDCTPYLGTKQRLFPELKKYQKECAKKRKEMADRIKSRYRWHMTATAYENEEHENIVDSDSSSESSASCQDKDNTTYLTKETQTDVKTVERKTTEAQTTTEIGHISQNSEHQLIQMGQILIFNDNLIHKRKDKVSSSC